MSEEDPDFAFGEMEFAVLRAPGLTSNDKVVYLAISSFRDAQSGVACPGRDALAKLTGLHVDSISRSTARLEKAGVLVKAHKGKNRAIYTLPLADARQAELEAAQERRRTKRAAKREQAMKKTD